MSAKEIDPSVLRGIAERILHNAVEDIEYLTVTEMTEDSLREDPTWQSMTFEQQDEVFHNVDAWLSKAEINIVFRAED